MVQMNALTSVTGSNLSFSGASTFSPAQLSTFTGNTVSLSAGFNFTLSGVDNIDNTTLTALNTSTFSAPVLNTFINSVVSVQGNTTFSTPLLQDFDGSTFTVGGGASVTLPIHTFTPDDPIPFAAADLGSNLTLPNLMTIDASGGQGSITIRADNGGVIAMPALGTVLGGPVEFHAEGPSSAVYIVNLLSFDPATTSFTEANFGIVAIQYPDDSDGDGLPDGEELQIHGTDPTAVDTDGDGMGDGYEVVFNFNPLDPSDANQDPDNDTLTNVEEFNRRSNPHDADSPQKAFYVSTGGTNTVGGGTAEAPWKTIAYALNQIAAQTSDDFVLVLLPGVYTGNIVLPPRATLAGVLNGSVVIAGTGPVVITGGQSAVLRHLEVDAAADNVDLLGMNNVGVNLKHVTFDGKGYSGVTGVLTTGIAPGGATISGVTLTNLDIGVDIFDSLPTIRRSHFTNLTQSAIVVHQKGKASTAEGSIGGTGDPNVGYNTFGTTGGPAVVNQRSDSLALQNNDWGTDDHNAIDAAIEGPATFEPHVPANKALLASTLTVTVWDTESLAPITNAEVKVNGFTVNSGADGVYLFASLPEATYTVTVSAVDHVQLSKLVTLQQGAIKNVDFPLPATTKQKDSDGDGLTDNDEILIYGTDPHNPDTNGDGITDDVEVAYGLISPIASKPSDLNGDGQTNAVDIQYVINGALGLPLPPAISGDVNEDQHVDAIDVQLVINVALGLYG